MINQLLQIQKAFSMSGYPLKGEADPRVRWGTSKGKICKVRKDGKVKVVDIAEGQLVHFVFKNNQNIYYRAKVEKKPNSSRIKKQIGLTIEFCKLQVERLGDDRNFKNLISGLENLSIDDFIAAVGKVESKEGYEYVYLDTNRPFVHTEEMVDISSDQLDHEASEGELIVDALGQEGHKVDTLYSLPPIAKGYDTKLFARNTNISGLDVFGENGLDTFPLTHQSAKRICGFAGELFSKENRYVENDGVVKGHFAIRVVGEKVFVIVSTIANSYFTLSIGHNDYDRLAGLALATVEDQDQSNSMAAGSLFVIEWNSKEAPCMRVSKTVSYQEGNRLAKEWFNDVTSGNKHPCAWVRSSDPEKPGGKGGGLTVLSMFDAINKKWYVTKEEIDCRNSQRVTVQDCYKLYLGSHEMLNKVINALINSGALTAMVSDSGLYSIKKRKLHAVLTNQLYPLTNLLIARGLRLEGKKMEQEYHWAYKLGQLCSTLNWMQKVSYESRDMETTQRPSGNNIVAHAQNCPQQALERISIKVLPILAQLEKQSKFAKTKTQQDEANKAANTWKKRWRDFPIEEVPMNANSLEKILITRGFCHKSFASGSVAPKTTAPLADVSSCE